MSYVVDTNILLRSMDPVSPFYEMAVGAVETLIGQGEILYLAPQNIIELWNVVTRPKDKNGFGMTPHQAEVEVNRLQGIFPVLHEPPLILRVWQNLVVTHQVKGVQVHDARIAAFMSSHGISNLLTFDTGDFKRFDHITAVHPKDVK